MFHKKLTKRIEKVEEKMSRFIRETSSDPDACGAILGERLASGLVRRDEMLDIIGHDKTVCDWVCPDAEVDSCLTKRKTVFDYIEELENRGNDLELKIVQLERIITKHISGSKKKKKKVSKSGRK